MISPFLMVEAKTGESLKVADRQNVYSAATAAKLFGLVDRQKDLGEIFAFTVSRSQTQLTSLSRATILSSMAMLGKYIHTPEILIYLFMPCNSYQFVMQVYKFWTPTHLKRLQSVLDE